jgi:hypothetical protein
VLFANENFINTTWSFLSKLSLLVPCLKNLEKSKCSQEETKNLQLLQTLDEQNMPICKKYKAFVAK